MSYIDAQNFVTPLQPGDEVITLAISSSLENEKQLLEGIQIFESWGLICRQQNITKHRWGYLAGDDNFRYQQLHPNNSAKLLAFAKGGWGAARLLERPQPWREGWLLGYSDITSVLLARLSAGFDGCVHGPLVTSLADEPLWSQERLKSLLFGQSIPAIQGEPWKGGVAQGSLVVANLTVGSHLIGCKHFPNLQDSILVLEDVGEAPYRIDRMLTQWRLAGLLQVVAGLGFGSFKNCEPQKDIEDSRTFQVEEILKERTKDLEIPIIANLPVGHIQGNAALPLGRQAILNGSKGELSLLL